MVRQAAASPPPARARSAGGAGALQRYREKRDFSRTPEPGAVVAAPGAGPLSFVVQEHHARQLHHDFRLEWGGVLLSWAVPRGPSPDPADKRLAVRTEDHPLAYGSFEGRIPEGQYGAGSVSLWDRGTWQPLGDVEDGLAQGRLGFELHGEKLRGRWELVRTTLRPGQRQESWLLFKRRDGAATPQPRRAAARREQQITHPERVIDAASGLTKLDLVRYYDSVAKRLLPYLKDRPVALLRAPRGVGAPVFFQRHGGAAGVAGMPGVRLFDPALWPGHEALLAVPTRTALRGAAQMNTVEFHPWHATTRHIGQPDRMVFDLDPGAGMDWPAIREGAQRMRALLQALGLKCWVKTSGGRGLHLVVPLAARWDSATVRGFAQAVVQHLAAREPARFVARSGAAHRKGRIFVDYLRNGEGATTVAAWSARARPGLPVSMPLDWDELDAVTGAAQWTVANAGERLAQQARDPWAGLATTRQSLAGPMGALGYTPPLPGPRPERG